MFYFYSIFWENNIYFMLLWNLVFTFYNVTFSLEEILTACFHYLSMWHHIYSKKHSTITLSMYIKETVFAKCLHFKHCWSKYIFTLNFMLKIPKTLLLYLLPIISLVFNLLTTVYFTIQNFYFIWQIFSVFSFAASEFPHLVKAMTYTCEIPSISSYIFL